MAVVRTMKTLDEVIGILERVVKHDNVWFDEKTALMTIETLTDILQYLRELRDMTDIPMEYFENGETSQKLRDTSQITCPKCHSEFVILPEANNALTWDELKQMEGKPVWLECRKAEERYWVFVGEWFDDDEMRVYPICKDYADYIHKNAYRPDAWQAYRKERDENA